MLRGALLVVAAVVCSAGLLGWATGHPGGGTAALWGAGLLATILLERWRYRRTQEPSGADWIRTDERFVDPETGRTVRVWYDPKTGARSYRDAEKDG